MRFRLPELLKRRPPLWLSIAGSIFILAAIYGISRLTQKAEDGGRWVEIAPAPLEITLGLTGYLDSADRQTLYAPFDGTVKEVLAREGDFVEAGQKVLVIDTTEIEIQLRQAQAERLKAISEVNRMADWLNGNDVKRARRTLSSAKSSLAETSDKLNESRRLYRAGIIARDEVDTLVRQQVTQQADYRAAEDELNGTLAQGKGENVDIAGLQLANAQKRYETLNALRSRDVITAPFSGNLFTPQAADGKAGMTVQSGLKVGPAMPLYDIARRDRLMVVAAVNENDVNQLSAGQSVSVTGDAFSTLRLTGKIQTVGLSRQGKPEAGGGSTYQVTVALDPVTAQQLPLLRPGMSARISAVTYRNPQAIVVPPEALTSANGQTVVVWRRPGKDTLSRTPVSPGRAAPAGIEVTGLPAGPVEVSISAGHNDTQSDNRP